MFLFFPLAFANEPPPPIVGGSVTNSFLQVGAIAALDPNGYGAAFCSGTLIDDTWILTAAHCIIGNDAAEGMANQGYDIYFVTATNIWSAGYGDWHPIKNMVSHPYYSGEEYEIANDIGLLELQSPLTNITPAVLNLDEPSVYWGDITYVGYGLTGDNEEDSMGIRRTVQIPMWTYPYPPQEDQFFYTHDPNGQKNICSGDSGGAAFRQTSSGYLLAGVNSHGFDINGGYPYCEGSDKVSASTRVDQYLDWISLYADWTSINSNLIGIYTVGNEATVTEEFCVPPSKDWSLSYFEGVTDGEISFSLYDDENNLIFSDGPFPTSGEVFLTRSKDNSDCDDSDSSKLETANDLDCDGYSTDIDCDDSDKTVNPGASEDFTDGLDNDCDGIVETEDFECSANLTMTFPDGETTTIDGCVDWSIDSKFDFEPDEPPALSFIDLTLNGTNDAGFECQVRIVQEDICGEGYFDLQDITGSTYAVTTDCSGVSSNNEGAFTSTTGYLRIDNIDTGTQSGTFIGQPLVSRITGYIHSYSNELEIEGGIDLTLVQIADTESEPTGCANRNPDEDTDNQNDVYYDGLDCNDTDPLIMTGIAINDDPNLCMKDYDGDGYGDMTSSELYVSGTDCNDDPTSDVNGDGISDAATIFPGSVTEAINGECMLDADGDGFGDDFGEEQFSGFYVEGTDCNDSDTFYNRNDVDGDGLSTCDGDLLDVEGDCDSTSTNINEDSVCNELTTSIDTHYMGALHLEEDTNFSFVDIFNADNQVDSNAYAYFADNILYVGNSDQYGNFVGGTVEFFWFESSIDRGSDFYVAVIKVIATPGSNCPSWQSGWLDSDCELWSDDWQDWGEHPVLSVEAITDVNRESGAFRWDWSVPFENYGIDAYGQVTFSNQYGIGGNAEGAVMAHGEIPLDESGQVQAAGNVQIKGYVSPNYMIQTQYEVSLYEWDVFVNGSADMMAWELFLNLGARADQSAYHEYFLSVQVEENESFMIDELKFTGAFNTGNLNPFVNELGTRVHGITISRPSY